ncbi:MAG: YggS family pyridoxal phosphate-dependent enzyme [Oscillospiraceae bacterium]|nr:YggS family pyridoxal phosphate-dependent enzyme [Oscillospiraceae bacterium]
MSIAENIAVIRAKMEAAALAAGRDPKEIALCAATKMNDTFAVRQAIDAGIDICGENRVQEMTQKLSENAYEGCPLHFIGRLQTNKVKQVVGKVALIQSVDRMKLLEAIQAEAAKQELVQDILLEINIGREPAKGGFDPDEIWSVLDKIPAFSNIRVCGLMAIPPISENSTGNHKFFQEMYNLSVDITRKKSDNVCMGILSMGMSDDFADAITCGSTMIRVGTAIFGRRDYSK